MKETISLCGAWTLLAAAGHTDIPAQVPGSVLKDLLDNGLIGDPFWRENELEAQRLFDWDYTYERTFDVPAVFLAHQTINLVFEGLDTLATVLLNGRVVLEADNMHRTWRVDAKPLLLAGENTLTVTLHAPNRFIAEAARQNPDVTYYATGSAEGSSFLRKAHCMFGWDWGPQLPDAGIWRPCMLEGYDLRIDSVEITQTHEPDIVTLGVRACTQGGVPAAVRAVLAAPDGTVLTQTAAGDAELTFAVENPSLWQPNGWGSQPLYTLTVSCLDAQGTVLDEAMRRVGLRTVEISRQKDVWGEEFCLQVNGSKLFAMGADYIPEDNLLGRTSPQRTRKLLTACARSHFNTIRVWGGGYYPEDWFFDLCDELGLIVWLDLMFACNVYKLTDAFAQSIVAETRDNLLRIRHHACVGLICGNNEMEFAWCAWPPVTCHSDALRADYLIEFEYILRKAAAAYAPQIVYWPSSPSSGGSFDDPNSFDRGDVHYWDVWHGLRPFADYRSHYPRFCSEFGFESFPCLATVESFTEPGDRNIFSRVMDSHQKCENGNGKIMYYISQNLRYPLTFAHVLYASQLLQAEAMRAGVEHWRRYRGRCMGAIYWQLNDCWPVSSWASVDYFGRWKQLQYAAEKFFAPVLISCERTGFDVRVSVVNDTREAFTGTAAMRLIDARGQTLATRETAVRVPALTPTWVMEERCAPVTDTLRAEDNLAVILTLRDVDGHLVSENCELFSPPKFFCFAKPHIALSIAQQGDDCEITLESDGFAWGVWLEAPAVDALFSDNGFFLLPGEARTVRALNCQKHALGECLVVTSVTDLG